MAHGWTRTPARGAAAIIVACGLALTPQAALAQCVTNGSTTTCVGDVANGVSIPGDNQTVIVNDGVTVNGGPNDAINLNGDGDNAVVTNNGAINATGNDSAVQLGDNGFITNNGVITGSGDGAIFEVTGGGDNLTIVNNGSISAANEITDESRSSFDGVTIINNGVMTSDDHGFDEGSTDGLTLRNSGTLAVGSGEALIADNNVRVFNSGVISSEDEEAIDLDNNAYIENSGTIRTDDEQAIEIQNGTVINSGLILSTGSNTSGTGGDYGIEIDNGGGSTPTTIINSGRIQGARGIYARDPVTIVNSGAIVGTVDDALNLSGRADVLDMRRGGSIAGIANFRGGTDTVIFTGPQNTGFVTENLETLTGVNAPVYRRGDIVAALDPTLIGAAPDLYTDILAGIRRATGAQMRHTGPGLPEEARETSFTVEGAAPSARAAWVSGFGEIAERDGDAARVDSTHRLGGAVAGYTAEIGAYDASLFIGGAGATARTDGLGQQVRSLTGFIGAQASQPISDAWTVGGGLMVGGSLHDSTRYVNFSGAAQEAEADYTSLFISPELRAAGLYELGALGGAPVGFAPSVSVSYAALFTEGYTESGSSLDATVDERVSHLGMTRVELAFPIDVSTAGGEEAHITPHIAFEGFVVGGDDAEAALLGVNQTVDEGGADAVGRGLIGATLGFDLGGGAELGASVEAGLDTDDGQTLRGGLMLRIPL